MLNKFTVTLGFINFLHGGIPILGTDLTEEERIERLKPWVAKQASLVPKDLQNEDNDPEAIAAALAEDETMPTGDYDSPLNGFRRVKGRPVIETRQVKALIRESAQRTGLISRLKMKQVIQHDVVVRALDNGDFLDLGVEDVSGIDERPIHVQTPQGPRSSIAMNEYVDGVETGAEITFVVKVLSGGVARETLTEERLRECFEYAEEFGALGANRAQGFGRFTVKEIKRG